MSVAAGESARALWYVAPGHSEIRNLDLAPPLESEIRVRALHGALSRGTEALIFAGRVPESEYARMRAPFMSGVFPFPVKYGYATVGRAQTGALAGREVFVLHPHQTAFNVPANAAVLLPDDVPTWRAVLGANMETALNAVWDAGTGPFGRIAVVGTGVVGALAGYLFGRLTNAEVWFIDIDESRTHVAHALGAHFALPHAAPRDCGLVVHASATAAGLATSLNLAAEEATVLELSWYGDTEVSVPLGGAFHSRRLKLVSSQVGKVAPSHRATYSHRRRLEAALSMLDDPRLDVLIAPAVRFEELPSRLPRVLAPDSGVLCQRIDYD